MRLFLWSLGGDIECTFDRMSVKNEALFMRPNTCVFTSGHAMYFIRNLLNNKDYNVIYTKNMDANYASIICAYFV